MKSRSKRSTAQQANDVFLGFTSSVSFDSRLWKYDIAGSIAHANALTSAGVLNRSEGQLVTKGLKDLAKEIDSGTVFFDPSLEDIHMNIETMLTKKIGDAGAKLHTGRSRNDQVALDLRLLVREAICDICIATTELQQTLIKRANQSIETVLPGYTHTQHAQPVLLAHHLMAHFWRLDRDLSRLRDCYRRTNISPLGAGALAGTTFNLDRRQVASSLGMAGITENSMDAVSDRDFVAETAFALSLLQIHLSSLSEELVLWSSEEFGFTKLPKGQAGGSSMMPQKLNPDIPELVRGKSGRALGDLVAILTLLKSLPLAYNRDLQEDKEALFDVLDTAEESLHALTHFLAEIEFDKVRMRKAAEAGLMTATDLADLLASNGIPFRKAHGLAKELAGKSHGDDGKFKELAADLLSDKGIAASDENYLGIENAVERRGIEGGTSRSAVLRQMEKASERVEAIMESIAKMRKDVSAIDRLLS